MIKNRLIWNIALFLIAIISLPLAYAQTSLGGSLYFVIVNAAIIGIILFALQSYLIPRKPEKERTVVWVVVLVASLLIAWLVGRDGYIWQGSLRGFFSIYVLVNAILIGAFLYFLLGFLKIGNLASPEGRTGYSILLFIVALIFAVKLGNQWIWDQGTIRLFGSYLFGSEGILNPSGPEYRLWTFIGSAVLLTFFFQNYLVTGGDKKVNYALALIIAANLASGGIHIRSVVIMAEIVFLITMAKTLGGTTTTTWGANWFIAAFLIGWGSAAATYGTEYEGGLASIVGWFLSWFGLIGAGEFARPTTGAGWFGWIGKAGIAALIPIAILVAIFFVIARGEIRRRILGLATGEVKKRINAITKSTDFMRDVPEGREPQFFADYRMLFHALANYTVRSEITYRYWKVVTDAGKMWNKVKDTIGEFLDQEQLRKDIIAFRSGGIVKTEEGAMETKSGWNRLNLKVLNLINRYLEVLANIEVSAEFKLKDIGEYTNFRTEIIQIQKDAEILASEINSEYEQYKIRTAAYGAHYALKAYRDIILNMTNVRGDILEHPQKFARPGAKFDMGDQVGKPDTAGANAAGFPTDEVDQFGEVIADIVEQKDSFGNLPDTRKYKRPRKVKPKDIIDYPKFTDFLKYVEKDWKRLAFDIRYGQYHPFSRISSAYVDAFSKKIYPEYEDEKIPLTKPPAKGEAYAVDLRALADPALNKYWGREKFYHEEPPTIFEAKKLLNPFPGLSSLGLKDFLWRAALLDIEDKEIARKYLSKYFVDSGVEEKEFPHAKIGIMWGEEPKESEREHTEVM